MKTKKEYTFPIAKEEKFIPNFYCEDCSQKDITIVTDPEWIGQNVHYAIDTNNNGHFDNGDSNVYNINPQSQTAVLTPEQFSEMLNHRIFYWFTEPYDDASKMTGYYYSQNGNYQGGGQQKLPFSDYAIEHKHVNRS